MAKAYLILNAVLYAGLAILCTVRFRQTSQGSGFLTLSPSGNSEYLVIYGGLQLGLAAFYALLSSRPEFFRLGLVFSILLYAPIVIYRVVTVARFWPVSAVTIAVGCLEVVLLVAATLLFWRHR